MSKYMSSQILAEDNRVIASGKSGEPQVLAAGGVKAVGKIVFTGNLVAGNTVTIGGTAFTCMASGAAGNQFNVDTTLALSLASLQAVLAASVVPAVAAYVYTVTDTNTAITATAAAEGLAANGSVLASNHSTVVVTQPVGGIGRSVVDLSTEHTQFTNSNTMNVTLPDGDETQRHSFANLGSGTVVLWGTFPSGNVKATFNGADAMVLQFLAGKWQTVMNFGAVFA